MVERIARPPRAKVPRKDVVHSNVRQYRIPSMRMIKAWRKDCGYTQKQAAIELGISARHYTRMECGTSPMGPVMWAACRLRWLTTDKALEYWTKHFGGKVRFAKMVREYVMKTD